MAILRLEPDEILPPLPYDWKAKRRGRFRFFGAEKNGNFGCAVELLPKRHALFAREVENEAAGNWLVYQRDSMKPAKWSPDSPRKIFENFEREFATRNWTLGRFFAGSSFPKKRIIGVLMAENKVGAWLDRELQTSTFFDFQFSSEVFASNRNQVQRFWKQESANPNSTIGFAARWKPSHVVDRIDVLLGESKAEVVQVMRWILACEPRFWERDYSWSWHFRPFSRFDRDFTWLICKHGPLCVHSFKHIAAKMPRTHQLMLFLGKQHLKYFAESLSQIHRCIKEGWELETIVIRLEVEGPPTAQERLEAAIQLRKWLHEHNAPAEIETLLNQNFQ